MSGRRIRNSGLKLQLTVSRGEGEGYPRDD
jgi:hypothetical protein